MASIFFDSLLTRFIEKLVQREREQRHHWRKIFRWKSNKGWTA